MINGIKKRLFCIWLDIQAIPTLFMNKKQNALYHLKHICPKCPKWRRQMRDVDCNGKCWWYENWKKGNYGVHRHYGVSNMIRQYVFLETDLAKYRKKLERKAAKDAAKAAKKCHKCT